MSAMAAVDEVRSFNRFYTSAIGSVGAGLHDTPWSLPEARVIFELGQADVTEVSDLRRSIGMDAGQLSRVLARLEDGGVVARDRSPADARRQTARLTPAGRDAYATLDTRSATEVAELLGRLGRERERRLLDAMRAIRTTLGDDAAPARPRTITLRADAPGDLGWIVERHGRVYADEYGWDQRFEALVARVCADFADERDPARDAVWIAEVDGVRAGCVMCVHGAERGTAKLRLLLVEPWARGHGLGARLVDECIAFARRAGYAELVLWTNDVLTDARRIYDRAGFELVASEPHRSFGHDLVGQTWHLPLGQP